eukprot:scaffold12693_cov142-Isochrysis_galbana.AAC.12
MAAWDDLPPELVARILAMRGTSPFDYKPPHNDSYILHVVHRLEGEGGIGRLLVSESALLRLSSA